MVEPASRDQLVEAMAKEVATHRRAIEVHEAAVAKFVELGQPERAERARTRLDNARRLLSDALRHEREWRQRGHAATSQGGADGIAHAVAGQQR